jgi:hypothetical protein
MGIWTMALPGATPVTSPLVGWIAGSIGAREGFGLAGIGLLATVGAGWRAPFRRGHTVLSPVGSGSGEMMTWRCI